MADLHELADAVVDAIRDGYSAKTIRREVERVMDECDDQFTAFDSVEDEAALEARGMDCYGSLQ
jgi:hypothetical protein